MRRLSTVTALILVLILPALAQQVRVAARIASEASKGVVPVGAGGKPLNLDFETGTLKDWTADGKAFEGQPIKGDTVYPRRSDNKSEHQGQYWIGGYERLADKPQGTLTSVAFKVTHPWASFLVGGGPWPTTCVELVRKDTGQIFFRASGLEEENLRRVLVDLQPHQGKEMFIRVVDKHSGHWGHINFDDFRFHAEKPSFPARPAHGTPSVGLPDAFKFAGLPPEKAAAVMTVPDEFTVKLLAGEPEVHQPIALCLDDRGRVWVAEAYSYPIRRKDKDAKDRIVIFEDADGDGKFDKRTVFMEGLNLVSGLEVGFGGVWIGAAPYLMFVPMKEGEDRPSGPAQILLDGWGYQDTHETLNTFIWGPDGWLYGCHGVFTHSRVGKPGTPDDRRIPLNAGIWRYHPTRHVFDVFAHGTSNPWGLDFNDHGEAFCEACVIPHAFHIIQGARYHRQAGQHFNPHTYADIQTIADHRHYVGATPHGGNNRSDSAGGGHAHCGTMIYLGGTWPEKYRGQMFMGNIHGRRLNVDILKPRGSGYVAAHGPDFLLANDAWARFINLRYGPDGNVYLIDWYDKQACHTGKPEIWDRTNGRIYKICYRGAKAVQVDLRKMSDRELVKLQVHENDWYVRHARRILQERGKLAEEDAEELAKIALEHQEPTRRLRGLWALHATRTLTAEHVAKALQDKDAHVRGWAIQLALEDREQALVNLDQLVERAKKDRSPVVRRYLASALQRLECNEREPILEQLLGWSDDAEDPNLPLLYWYGLEPLAGLDDHRARALAMAAATGIPRIFDFTVRRMAADATRQSLDAIVRHLVKADDVNVQLAMLRALNDALKGRRLVEMPTAWVDAFPMLARSTNAEVRVQVQSLAASFGDRRALDDMRQTLLAENAEPSLRQQALAGLLAARDPKLPPVLHQLLADANLRGPALRALAAYDDPQTPDQILARYGKFSSEDKRDALNTLAARTSYARVLIKGVANEKVKVADLSADLVRQLRNLQDKEVNDGLTKFWGIIQETPAERAKLIAQYRTLLTAKTKIKPDPSLGRAIYAKSCAQCHKLFELGNNIGPELTGSNRANLDYLLENIIDPSAVIQKEYAATLFELQNGRIVTGIIKSETPQVYTVATANEVLTLPAQDVASKKITPKSMMPDDLLKPLKDYEVRSLIAYLQSPTQVPLLATPENAKDFFNGKDLTGWDGDAKLWRVENGEIVGKSPGLKHNEFLRSHMAASDFKLTVKVKLVPNSGNSGIQFRSEALPAGEMKGPQADIGAGWWGKLYDENGRGLLSSKSGEEFVKAGEWNEYEIVASGSRIRTSINGKLCLDLEDTGTPRRGIFALQLHSGPALEVRFKDVRLYVE